MLVHQKDDFKLCLGFHLVPFSKTHFVWKVDFVKIRYFGGYNFTVD